MGFQYSILELRDEQELDQFLSLIKLIRSEIRLMDKEGMTPGWNISGFIFGLEGDVIVFHER